MVNVARVDDDNVVVNVEVASEEWLSRPTTLELGYRFIPYTDDNVAWIGLTYDPATGLFEQPPTVDYPTQLPEGTDDE